MSEQHEQTDGVAVSTDGDRSLKDRSTAELVRDIVADAGTLVRKEVELARQELTETAAAKAKGAGAMAVAGVFGLLAVVFLAAAAAWALAGVMPAWAARLVVAGGLLLLAGLVAGLGRSQLKRRPVAPTETKRTVKEDVRWARAQLKR